MNISRIFSIALAILSVGAFFTAVHALSLGLYGWAVFFSLSAARTAVSSVAAWRFE